MLTMAGMRGDEPDQLSISGRPDSVEVSYPVCSNYPPAVHSLHVRVMSAGEIASGASVAEAIAMGYTGVHMGTWFIATTECTASEEYKQAIADAEPDADVLLRSCAGAKHTHGKSDPNYSQSGGTGNQAHRGEHLRSPFFNPPHVIEGYADCVAERDQAVPTDARLFQHHTAAICQREANRARTFFRNGLCSGRWKGNPRVASRQEREQREGKHDTTKKGRPSGVPNGRSLERENYENLRKQISSNGQAGSRRVVQRRACRRRRSSATDLTTTMVVVTIFVTGRLCYVASVAVHSSIGSRRLSAPR